MKNNQNHWRSYRFKILVFTFLLLLASACAIERNKKDSGAESPSRNNSADKIKKAGTKNDSKESAKNEKGIYDGDNEDDDEVSVNNDGDDLKVKVCKKYESCGCQSYEKCMQDAEEGNFSDETLECILKSSCKSLCAGNPDGCAGSGNNPGTGEPEKPHCPQIKCNKNSDCPMGCYGGCSGGHCLLF